MGLKIINKLAKFATKNAVVMDRALNRMAVDVERLSKEQVPFLKGHLKASAYHERVGFLNWRVVYNKVYAMYQHEGGDGKRVVRKYSYPGKKKHYLSDPGKIISGRATEYFRREAKNLFI